MHDTPKTRKSEENCSSDDDEYVSDNDNETIGEYQYKSRDCAYVKHIEKCSDLAILKLDYVLKAWKSKGPAGLFYCFLTRQILCKRMRVWTEQKSNLNITQHEMSAYVGLEMAMSICRFNKIRDYWTNSPFLGNNWFKNTMARDRFTQIRANLQLVPPNYFAGSIAENA